MYFGNPPVINPKTGKPKLTVPGNWVKQPLREWTLLLLGLALGFVLSLLVG